MLQSKLVRLGAPLLGVATALLLSGCADFQTAPTGNQTNAISSVQIQTQICLDGFGADSNSSYFDEAPVGGLTVANTAADTSFTGTLNPDPVGDYVPRTDCSDGNDAYGMADGQLLIGYEIPNGSTAPTTISSFDLPGITFSQDPDYSSYLASNETTDPSEQWVGYISSEIDNATSAEDVNFNVSFPLPTNADGTAWEGPFNTEEVVGDRVDNDQLPVIDSPGVAVSQALAANDVSRSTIDSTTAAEEIGSLTPDRSLDCSETAPDEEGGNYQPTECVEDSGQVSVDTHDLQLIAPNGITGQAGTTVEVPFTVSFAGSSDPTETFGLSSTNTASATSTPADASIQPATNSTSTENVAVPLPSGLAPGSYQVTLTAVDSDPNACSDQTQCTRNATATITVTAAPTPTAPVATPTPVAAPSTPTPAPLLTDDLIRMGSPSVMNLYRHGENVSFSCSQACSANLRLFVYYRAEYRGERYRKMLNAHIAAATPKWHKITVGTARVNLSNAGADTVNIKLDASSVHRLAKAGGIIIGSQLFATTPQGTEKTKLQQLKVNLKGLHYLEIIYARDKRLGIPFTPNAGP